MLRLLEILFTILIAVSLIRSVLNALQTMFGGGHAQNRRGPRRPQATQSAEHTTLQQDPVCGTYVSTETSLKRLQSGRVIHFCSAECRDRYTA